MAKPAPPQLTDYAVTAISPALIMAMVGSLVFFLVEVLYDGRYSDRLIWTLFFFVVGTVLIARILILYGASRALIYAAGLAAATFLALQAFVDYPNLTMRSFAIFINAGLMALIWWSANKLTWDCTHIDEDRRNAGRGVLDAATEFEEEPPATPLKPNATWIERWLHYRKIENQKPHTPGVWVLYFSLAALPIFGLGQSLIPATDEERRGTVFNHMVVYVASGLGLLATTTLLGLRKYLRDRGAAIPGKMTAGWLGLAAGLIVVFLVLAAVLPRPHSETALISLPKWAKSKDRDANRNAQVKDSSHGEGEGAPGEQKHDDRASQTKEGEKGAGEKEEENAKAAGGAKGEQKGGSKEKQKSESSSTRQERQSDSSKSESDREDRSSGQGKTDSTGGMRMSRVLESVSNVLKWLAWIIIALLCIAAIAIFILRYLAPFTSWAKNLLDWLSGLWKKKAKGVVNEPEWIEAPPPHRPPPFSNFTSPIGQRIPVEDMVTYSFTAFESWAFDRGLPRRASETPFEFARRIAAETGVDGQPLVKLYGQVVYSRASLSSQSVNTVSSFWMKLNQGADAPRSPQPSKPAQRL